MMETYIKNIDVLIVDKIGKDMSGDGADPQVTGAFLMPYANGGIQATRRVVLDLTDTTLCSVTPSPLTISSWPPAVAPPWLPIVGNTNGCAPRLLQKSTMILMMIAIL